MTVVNSRCCKVFSACFFLISTLSAQNPSLDSLAKVRVLEPVVIQSTRTGAQSPVPHSNFSAEAIGRQLQAQDVPYLLSAVPSLVETSDGGTGIGYTGLRIRGSDPTRVNVTINGIPLNDAESQGVFWVDLPDLAASAAEIQVQRGVGTSTNGAGAFGATVNLDLSALKPERFATLSNTFGSFGTRKHSLQVGTGLLDSKLAFTARVSGIRSEGYVDRASANLNAVHLSGTYLDGEQSCQVHFLSGHEITYQAWNGLPAQYLELEDWRTFNTAGTERPLSPHPNEVDDYTQRHYLLHYKRLLAKELTLQLNGHYTQGFGFYEQYKADQDIGDYGLPLGFVPDTTIPPMDLIRRRWLDNDFYGGTFALRWKPQGAWNSTFMLGGAWSRYEGEHFGEVIWAESYTGAPNDFRYYENSALKNDANVFFKVESQPWPRVSTLLDLQVRGVSYEFRGFDNDLNSVQQSAKLSFFNPKIGASYSLSKIWRATAFAGLGHREPNRDDYTQSTPRSRPLPEQLLDFEFGLQGKGDKWSVAATLFWMQYKNQLVLNGRINDVGAYTRSNVPNSFRRGVEIEMESNPFVWLNFTGSVAFSQNKVHSFQEFIDNWDTGEQEVALHRLPDLAFSPNIVSRGECTLLAPKKNGFQASLSLIGKYVSKQFLDNTSNDLASLPGYFVSDIRLNFDLFGKIGKQVSLIVALNNWLDSQYASNGWVYRYVSANYDARPDNPYTRLESGDVYHLAGYFPQAGRNWMATLRFTF